MRLRWILSQLRVCVVPSVNVYVVVTQLIRQQSLNDDFVRRLPLSDGPVASDADDTDTVCSKNTLEVRCSLVSDTVVTLKGADYALRQLVRARAKGRP